MDRRYGTLIYVTYKKYIYVDIYVPVHIYVNIYVEKYMRHTSLYIYPI